MAQHVLNKLKAAIIARLCSFVGRKHRFLQLLLFITALFDSKVD